MEPIHSLVLFGVAYAIYRWLTRETKQRHKKKTATIADALINWEHEQNFPPPDLTTATCPDPPDRLMTPHIIWTFLTFLNYYTLEKEAVRETILSADLRGSMTEEEFFVLFMRVERYGKWRREVRKEASSPLGWATSISTMAELAKREGIAPNAIYDFINEVNAPSHQEKMVFYNRLANFTCAHVPGWGDSDEAGESRTDTPGSS